MLEVRSTKKKMREDAVPLSERAPVFSPDVTNFVADERVFLDSLLRRERGGEQGVIVINVLRSSILAV